MNKKKQNNKPNNKKSLKANGFVSADDMNYDPYGSYTGTTAETFYNDEYDEPVQDADDL